MRFTLEYPIGSPGYDARFLEPQTMARFVQQVEALGYDAVAFTEHPAPSQKWLEGGGHASVDPLTALSFCAAVTSRIRLMTYLLVLPYRNPLLAAKQIATADLLSGGRLTVVAGTGYLRSEFAALGVDFDERNELFDEALDVLRDLWAGEAYVHEGRHWKAVGQVSVPTPVQRPHPPIWIGGNSALTRHRVATAAQGWAGLVMGAVQAKTTRTPALETVDDVKAAIDDIRRRAEAAGRDPGEIDVQVQWRELSAGGAAFEQVLDRVGQLADIGVTWVALQGPNADVDGCLEALAAYADSVVAKAR